MTIEIGWRLMGTILFLGILLRSYAASRPPKK